MEIYFGDVGEGKTRFMLLEAIKSIKNGGSVEYWNMGDNINLSDLAFASKAYKSNIPLESFPIARSDNLNVCPPIEGFHVNLSDYQCLENIVEDLAVKPRSLFIIDGYYPGLFKPILSHTDFLGKLNNLLALLSDAVRPRVLYSWSGWEFDKEFFGFLGEVGVTHIHHVLSEKLKTYELGVDIKTPKAFRVWSP